jgi:hypothetical protein
MEAVIANMEQDEKFGTSGVAYQRHLIDILESHACEYLIGTRDITSIGDITLTSVDHVLYLDQLADAYIKYAQFARTTHATTAAIFAQKAIAIYEYLYGGTSHRILVVHTTTPPPPPHTSP